MKEICRRLIASLDDDEGVPEATYYAIYQLLDSLYGPKVAQRLALQVNAQDGRFYLNNGMDVAQAVLPD